MEYGRTNQNFREQFTRSISLRPNEFLEEIQYNKADGFSIKAGVCFMTLITNMETYHLDWAESWIAENPTERKGYCGNKQFSVRIPKTGNLNSFFESNIIYGTYKKHGTNWILGFKTETEIKGL